MANPIPPDLQIYRQLSVCPFCAKKLEINPLSGNKACFVHGDFIVKTVDGKIKVEFDLTMFGFREFDRAVG